MKLGLGSRVLRVAMVVAAVIVIVLVACAVPVTPPAAGPQFLINSPTEGGFTAGTFFFAVQPFDASAVQKVDFEIDGVPVGSDSTASDGFRVAVAASDHADGEIVLRATVTGTSGASGTQSITVENVPNPPSSDTVDADGAVLGTARGSTLVIRPGEAVGATVSFTEQTQAQVRTETGIDYAGLGVTFLGAQEIDSDMAIEQPLMVSSADFAADVQPGDAIVNYQIAPDLDGDGIGELVVVNTASIAGNDVISDPVPQIQLGEVTITGQAGTTSFRAQQQGFTGRPGDFVEIEATGFNTVSLRSNRVTWTANGTVVEATAQASESEDGSSQLVAFGVPLLPAGPATVELRNVSTGSSVSLDFTIEPVASSLFSGQLAGTTEEIIDGFMQDTIAFIQGLPTDGVGSADIKSQAVAQFVSVRMDLLSLFAALEGESVPELEEILDGVAVQIQNAPDLFATAAVSSIGSQELSPKQKKLIKDINYYTGILGAALGLYGKLGKIGAAKVCTKFPQVCLVGLGLEIGNLLLKSYEKFEDGRPGCEPIHTEVIESLKRLTGMGSVPPAGGPGCGNAPSGVFPVGPISTSQVEEPDPIIIKVFVGGQALPFTGVTDPGGYFYIPLIPEDEPFTAIAINTANDEVRSFEGVGPPDGESVYIYFNFLGDDNAIPNLSFDSNVQGDLELDETELYVFVGTAGQLISLGTQGEPDFDSNYDVNLFSPTSSDNLTPFLGNGRFYSETGVIALTDPGIHTLVVASNFSPSMSGSGTYNFGLSNIDQPTPIDISTSPTTIPGEQTVYGGRHYYSFDAQAGDILKFSLSLPGGSQFNALLNLLGPGPEPFYEREDQFFPGFGAFVSSLDPLAVSNPFVVPESGEYIVEIERGNSSGAIEVSLGAWEFSVLTPDPATAIAIGDTVMDSVGLPGEIDLFTFDAAAGQKVDFSTANVDQSVNQVNWSVTAPDGTVIFDEPLFTDPGTFTLAEAGTYTVMVGSDADDGTGAYEFTLLNVP